jgi:hypothetical protein
MRHCLCALSPLRRRSACKSELRSVYVGRVSPLAETTVSTMIATLRRIVWREVQLCSLAVLVGCATAPPPPPPHPMDNASPAYAIAIVPVTYAPGSGSGGQTDGEARALGAVKGAGVGALAGGLLVGIGAIVFPPLGVPLGLALTPYLAAGGAIGGYVRPAPLGPEAATGIPEEQSPILDRTLNDVLSDMRLPELTGSALVHNVATLTPFRAEVPEGMAPVSKDGLPDYRSLRDRGFGEAIEIRITRVGFAGWVANGISLFVTAESRLIDTETGNPTWLRGLVYESPTRSFSRWTREGAALTRVELERAYRTLSERIVDVLFLSTEPSGSLGGNGPDTCGVALLEPRPALEIGPQNRQRLVAPLVSSRTPTLAWSVAPLAPKMFNPNPSATDSSLRYDLRIWSAEDDAPGNIVYERLGLTGTRHQVEVPLEPASTYFWSVRMRGAVNGHLRAVPWSMSNAPPVFSKSFLRQARFEAVVTGGTVGRHSCSLDSCIPCGCLDYIPAENSYRFVTP